MRELSLRTRIAVALLVVIAASATLIYFAISSSTGSSATTGQPGAAETPPIILSVRAIIDGGDLLTISPAGAVWTHGEWQWPTAIAINGVPFDPHKQATLEKIGLQDADLSSAQVISRFGRCTVAMEKTSDGIAIHFADPIAGAAQYSIKIGFSPKSPTPALAPATLPASPPSADSILLDIKATVIGSDVMTITPQNISWRHVSSGEPSDISINGRPWNTRMHPTLSDAGLTNIDLSSAQVIQSSGRDTLVMEKQGDRVVIYFGDAVNNAYSYEIKIRFSPTHIQP